MTKAIDPKTVTHATIPALRRQMLAEMGKGWEPWGELSIENESVNVRARWVATKGKYESTAFIGNDSSCTASADNLTEAVDTALKMRAEAMYS